MLPRPEGSTRQRGGARHNIPLAVLTNKPEHATLRILDGLGLSHLFLAVVGGDGTFPRKPDPAALQYLVRAARAPLEATWLVGDSPIDAETARRAGVRFCAARYGFGWRDGTQLGEQDLAVDSSQALRQLIEELAQRS